MVKSDLISGAGYENLARFRPRPDMISGAILLKCEGSMQHIKTTLLDRTENSLEQLLLITAHMLTCTGKSSQVFYFKYIW